MNLVPKLVTALKEFDRKVWPAHRVVRSPAMVEALAKRNLMIGDVGVADGPEERWLGIGNYTRYLTFDPKPREGVAPDSRTVCLPIGLWSSKTRKLLYLNEHPDSSSLYPFNDTVLGDFLAKGGARLVGTTEIELDTLDNCLVARPELSPDFLKVDAEGADLEVLRGADGTLRRTIMGVRVETLMMDLRCGAPRLGDFDPYLRERGFLLFHLGRVHFIRNNGLHGFTSQPQLAAGDFSIACRCHPPGQLRRKGMSTRILFSLGYRCLPSAADRFPEHAPPPVRRTPCLAMRMWTSHEG